MEPPPGRQSSIPWNDSQPSTPGLQAAAAADYAYPDEADDATSASQASRLDLADSSSEAVPLGLDIGGSLAKLAFLTAPQSSHEMGSPSSSQSKLHLCYYETTDIEDCASFVAKQLKKFPSPTQQIFATGGGAHKYAALFQNTCGTTLQRLNEFACLVLGCTFLLQNIEDEAFTFHAGSSPERRFVNQTAYPFLLVNVGSGCSVLLVRGPRDYERVDGSAVGGGTFWGLGSLLTGQREFDDVLREATEGNSQTVDMLVRDIYGEKQAEASGLDATLTASCFGKAARLVEGPAAVSKSDMAASLLQMIAYNLAQIACLNARLHNVKNIVFAGFFLRGQRATMKTISEAVGFWGRQRLNALFLRHEGYLGCIGAFLHSRPLVLASAPPATPEVDRPATVSENFVTRQQQRLSSASVDNKNNSRFRAFALEVRPDPLVPLLQLPESYAPDTIDLMFDAQAREYWLTCFENNIDREYERAKLSGKPEASKTEKRALAFRQTFLQHMGVLRQDETVYGQLSVRSILELRQQCLREFHFLDPYEDVKQMETAAALALLEARLAAIDKLTEPVAAARDVIEGVLAGNAFDWGATATAARMESNQLHFDDEKIRIRQRQWLVDDCAVLVQRILALRYRQVLIFVDNAGADVVLGVLPLARFLLQQGCRVVLAANTLPVLNDVTAEELRILLRQASAIDSTLAQALSDERLRVMESGSGSPCLDLSKLDWRLVAACESVDLILLIGMGRAVHSNFYLRCRGADVVKLAMIKNAWLAQKLGGQIYDVVCKLDIGEDGGSREM